MRKLLITISIVLATGISVFPLVALSEVLKVGKVSNGYYWQLVTGEKGQRWLCRSTSEGRIQKHQKCQDAGAVKP